MNAHRRTISGADQSGDVNARRPGRLAMPQRIKLLASLVAAEMAFRANSRVV